MFTEDGKFVATDAQERAFLSVEYACLACHQDRDRAQGLGDRECFADSRWTLTTA
jgi:hypothetical protein